MLKLQSEMKDFEFSLLIGSLRTYVISNIYRLHMDHWFCFWFAFCNSRTFRANLRKITEYKQGFHKLYSKQCQCLVQVVKYQHDSLCYILLLEEPDQDF